MSDTKRNARVRAELNRIAAKSGGILQPAAVVDAARPKSSPLHDRFDWNDSEAAAKYRIWQARQLISITLTVIDSQDANAPAEKMWVSLTSDRKADGGYRPLVRVLSDADMREQLLADALADLEVFRLKYGRLAELAKVFAAARKVEAKARKRAK